MPRRGTAPAARTREKPEPEDTAEEPADPSGDGTEAEEARPARRRGGRRTRAEEGAKSEAGADMDGQLPPDEPEEEEKPRRGRRNRTPKENGTEDSTEPRQRHATQDVVRAREYDFSDIDESEMELGSLEDEPDHLSVLYYGREGTTKTTSALRMTALPGKGRVLLVNAEGGAKAKALAKHGVDPRRVATWPQAGKRVTFAGLEALFYRLAADLEKDPDSWLGVVWDSGTEIVQTVLDQVVEDAIREQEEIIAKTRGRAGNVTVRDRFDTDRDDYRKMSNMVRSLVRKWRYLPCHFVMTALTREDEKGKKTVYGPKFTPALADDILGYMDQVLYVKSTRNRGKPVYYATTVQADDDRAKDRYDSLPRELVDPGFDRVLGYIEGSIVAAEDPVQDKMPGGAVEEREPEEKPAARAGRASGRRTKQAEPEPDPGDANEEVPADEAQAEPAKPVRTRTSRARSAGAEAKADEAEMTDAQRAVIEEQAAKKRVLAEQADKEATPAQRARTSAHQRRATAANEKPAPARRGKTAEVKYNDEPPF